MISCPVLLILLKRRETYYLVGGTSCLVGGISYAVCLLCIFLSTSHIPLSPIKFNIAVNIIYLVSELIFLVIKSPTMQWLNLVSSFFFLVPETIVPKHKPINLKLEKFFCFSKLKLFKIHCFLRLVPSTDNLSSQGTVTASTQLGH